ncbi:glycerophosphodiester phosphodiesterase [Flaviaesturariibacter flavus]|uniref:Glycerophosphodiester phosphodiesterase n=1 Tax=Flaviaesturariibacter flavus TaxID=2502780 RepID=A0A4R1B693_9BACT|nr:glycerophosphodiester phosphodiesterase family protein [Flaviaesturariibacter flavus]TCJ13160.1 glycerophosphodiester phosphodiesterase [Flaviaesturariibacter flavus]
MIPLLLLLGGAATAYIVYRARHVRNPRRRWRRFRAPGTAPLDGAACRRLEGVYRVTAGQDFVGGTMVLRWSYTVERGKLLHHLSFFSERDGTYFVCAGRSQGPHILLSGYWRKLTAAAAGTVRLEGLELPPHLDDGNLQLAGSCGTGNRRPRRLLQLERVAPLPQLPPFHIIAHRGGARNVDFLPVAENSLPMLLMAAQLGATGVEIDIRWTSDDVPVLAHDSFLAFDSVRTPFFAGFIRQQTLAELRRIRLRKGGRVPTLREALETVVYCTPLELVWLDIKEPHPLDEVVALQQEYQQRAAAIGRRVEILIGIAAKETREQFEQLPDYRQIPSLCELDPEAVRALGSVVWAPQYTGGPQPEAVAEMQQEGHRVFVWSLDHPMMIRFYMDQSPLDGLVSNAAPVVAHWWWTSAIGNREPSVVNRES